MNRAVRALVALLAVLTLAALAVVFGAGRLVKTAVEQQGTASLRLQTTLGSATVSLLSGKLRLNRLAIASPRGFSAPHLLQAAHVSVSLSYRELRREPIHVRAIVIDEPTLVIEQSGGALNFRKAMALVPATPPGQKPIKLVIDRLELTHARVLVRPGLPGLSREIEVQVPQVVLKDVGRGRGAHNGAALKDVTVRVILALAAAAAQSDAVPLQVRALLRLAG